LSGRAFGFCRFFFLAPARVVVSWPGHRERGLSGLVVTASAMSLDKVCLARSTRVYHTADSDAGLHAEEGVAPQGQPGSKLLQSTS
jgi:hypothetical protein